jgi:hypothetical protein
MYNGSYNTRGYRGNHRRRVESKIDRFARIRESLSSFPAFSFSTKPPRRYRRPTVSRPPAVARVCVSRPSCARASTVDTSSAPRRIVPKCGTTRAGSTPATKTDFCVPLRSEVYARAATTTTATTTTRGSAPGRAKAARRRRALVFPYSRRSIARAIARAWSATRAASSRGLPRRPRMFHWKTAPPSMDARKRGRPRRVATDRHGGRKNLRCGISLNINRSPVTTRTNAKASIPH